MSTTSHTPGPWHYAEVNCHAFVLDRPLGNGPFDGNVIASSGTNANDRADLRLIAAAPDMLEALRRMLAAHEADVEHGSLMAMGNNQAAMQARAAIAKAEGKA